MYYYYVYVHNIICRLTMCSRWTCAGEAVDEVDAGASMEAGLGVAFINIILTVHPLVAWFTLEK